MDFYISAKVEDGRTIVPAFSIGELILRKWRANYLAGSHGRVNVKRPMYAAEAQSFHPPTMRELQWAYFGIDKEGQPISWDYQEELTRLITEEPRMDKVLGEWTSSFVLDGRYLLERPRVITHYSKKFIRNLPEEPDNSRHFRKVDGSYQAYITEFRGNFPTRFSPDANAARDAGGYLFISTPGSWIFFLNRMEELEIPFSELQDGKVVSYTNQGFPARTASNKDGMAVNENSMFNGNAHLDSKGITSTAVVHYSLMDPFSSFNMYSFLPSSGGDGIGARSVRRNVTAFKTNS